jgi:apoptosis-inducing factor 3
MTDAPSPSDARHAWPEQGLRRIPDWVYTDDEVYQREVERIFHGRTWNYVALAAEIPKGGDFIRSNVGPTPVVVARSQDGAVHVVENRCAHRAAEFCRDLAGNTSEFVCPYHQWTYESGAVPPRGWRQGWHAGGFRLGGARVETVARQHAPRRGLRDLLR